MSEKEIMRIFRETKVWQEGHFLLTSGRHSGEYIQCARVLQYPRFTETLCFELAKRFKGEEIDVVAAPAVGGIIIAYEVAKILQTRAIFAERENGKMVFRRGFEIDEDEKVLVVEDVITTGGSVREVIQAVRACGGDIRGAGVFVDRSGGKVSFDTRVEALLNVTIKTYSPEECPLCREQKPLVKPGSRKLVTEGAETR
ncbi:MAG TPA: orotate phosphoribosyltransferase [Firmicutes bacterium]|nr:orotate phosphoribosyltransferase [Bacillota bacterium]